MFKWGNKSIEKMSGVNVLLVECATRALRKSDHDMTIPWRGGVRTAEQQKEIFEEGNSKCDGYDKKSYHQSGNALDVIPTGRAPYTNYRALNHFAQKMYEAWQDMVREGKDEGFTLQWGGLWGSIGWDRPHWQLTQTSTTGDPGQVPDEPR